MKTKEERIDYLKKKCEGIRSILYKDDELSKHFYGGMVGFKNGSNRKKWENNLDKEMRLYKELKDIESKIERLEKPLKVTKSKEIDPTVFKVGDIAKEPFGTNVKIIKINTKTVTVEFSGGYKCTYKPHLLTNN